MQALSSSGSMRSRGHSHVCAAKNPGSGAAGSTKARPAAKKKGGSGGGSAGGPATISVKHTEEVLMGRKVEDGVASNIVPAGVLGASTSRHHRALVLDSAYRPIHVWPWHKAVMNDVLEKCEVVIYYDDGAVAWSGRGPHKLPAVVRVDSYVDMNKLCKSVTVTPRNVLMRDSFECKYCGSKDHLTLDHIVPTSKGGKSTWRNLVCACMTCNSRKGDKTLQQLGWKIRGAAPKEPRPWEVGFVAGLRLRDLIQPPEHWGLFLEPYRAQMGHVLDALSGKTATSNIVSQQELDLEDLYDA